MFRCIQFINEVNSYVSGDDKENQPPLQAPGKDFSSPNSTNDLDHQSASSDSKIELKIQTEVSVCIPQTAPPAYWFGKEVPSSRSVRARKERKGRRYLRMTEVSRNILDQLSPEKG